MTVASVLRQKGQDVICVPPAMTVPEIAEIIASRRIGAVVVLDPDRHIIGIVSERDVVKALAAHGGGVLKKLAEDLMTRDVVSVTPETSVQRAMEIMDHGYFRHLPVLQEGELVGIVSIRDLVKHRFMQQEQAMESIKAIASAAVPQEAGR